MSSSALRAACRRLSRVALDAPASTSYHREWGAAAVRHLHSSHGAWDSQHHRSEAASKGGAATGLRQNKGAELRHTIRGRVAERGEYLPSGSMLKGIREDDKFAKETALTDEFKHTILHTDSLYTLMTRMTNPVHNVRAVLVALREIGFPGQFPKCKFDEGTGAMCGPCVMRNRNAVRNDANEKNHEPCFDRSLGGRAISCFDWQEWTYAALYCQLWVAGCAAAHTCSEWSLTGLETNLLQFQLLQPHSASRAWFLASCAVVYNVLFLEYARVWLAGTTYRAIGWRIVKYASRWRRYRRWL